MKSLSMRQQYSSVGFKGRRKLGGTLSDATVENGALRINSVQKSHVGSYMCSANTGIRSLRGFSTLQVKGMNISASFF